MMRLNVMRLNVMRLNVTRCDMTHRDMTHRDTYQRAFTLVELLVVISIIALLIAILMPSLSGARRQARAAVCLARESQLGQAINIYANQFDGSVPQVYGGPVAWGEKRGALYQLVVTSGILADERTPPELLVCTDSRPKGAVSFALNAVVFGYRQQELPDDPPDDDPAGGGDDGADDDEDSPDDDSEVGPVLVSPLKLSMVRSASKVVAIYDVRPSSLAKVWHVPVDTDEADISDQFTGAGMLGTAHPNPAGFMWQKSLDEPSVKADTPHGNAHNVLFIDGHAEGFTKWRPSRMTRLTGREPNDTLLY